MAFMQGCIASGSRLSKAFQIFVPSVGTEAQPVSMSHFAEAQHHGQGKNLSLDIYNLMLAHINLVLSPSQPLCHFKDFPHPMDAKVLPQMAIPFHHIKHKGHGYSTFSKHPGNSSI